MMGEWSYKKLGEYVKINGGNAFKSNEYQEVGTPLLRISNIKDHLIDLTDCIYVSDDFIDTHKQYLLDEGNIVIAMSGATTGKTGVVRKENLPLLLNQRVGVFNIKDKTSIFESFLQYVVESSYFQNILQIDAVGGAQPNISPKQIESINIYVPPIQEQQKIAAILSSVDEAIEKTEQIIEQTERVKKGLMQELLTKGIGHTEFKESPVGRIPKEWSINYLEELVNFQNGKAHEKYVVDDGNYILINSKFISTDGQEMKKTNKNLLPLYSNDIAMVMSDVPNGKAIAKCFYTEEENIYTVNQRVCRLEPKNIYGKYLYYYLNRNRYFLSFDNGVSQTNLRKQEVLDCPVKVPTMKEQEKIVKILDELERAIEIEYKKRTHLARLKQGLMQQLLTGKKRVKVDDSEEVLS